MIKKRDVIEIKIDSLAYGGEGVGKVDGYTVFVPDSAPGDVLAVEIISAQKSYAKGKIVEIIEPSASRIKPACGLAKTCGGCNWQHIDYKEQLKAKRQIVEDNLKRIAHVDIPVKDVLPSDNIFEYRCKVQYPVQQTKISKRFLIGYYKKGSHEIINTKRCPIQPKIIDIITEFIRNKAQELKLTAYNEETKKGLIRHIVFRYSQTNNDLLLIFVINAENIPNELRGLSKAIKKEFAHVKGVLINFNTTHTNVIFGQKTVPLEGIDYFEETLEGRTYRISANSFFQVNPSSAVKMFNTVRNIVEERLNMPAILDVYAGVGSFAIWLKDIASNITAIEESPQAVEDAKRNIDLNKAPQDADITVLEGNADTVLESLATDNKKYDVVILDPPRKGCSQTAINSVIKLADKYIIYISCNPSTLARDVKLLTDSGFTPEFAQPVDMFCHTYHVESIVVLKK